MGNDFDKSQVIKICVVGEEKGIIDSLFPYSMEVDDKVPYKKKFYIKILKQKII